jgi:hypothetical protein
MVNNSFKNQTDLSSASDISEQLQNIADLEESQYFIASTLDLDRLETLIPED